ncbi:hypothetical protein DL89DRAFT_260176 [Linderina pennispora]|uniref:Uncharacterized protein n=1 Tax=Linderina pennispora TaxID=61395 RepID=A0A1Y1VZT1_9FUNG|nr:uncharacterized protein DL89DRAFT_260176 [Linderina pennispora]ORX66535.1 hypothetical protein DL89DRAFT_260176 [Linderina pennispora]
MGIIAPMPRTFLFRGLADEGTEIQGEFGTGIQRMYLEMYQISACQLAYSNRDTIKELVLRLTPDADDEIALGDISEDLESLFNCIYPKLTRLSIETGQDVVGCFSLPDINLFPSLTSLSLNTYCDFDIGFFVDDASDNLTSLTIYLTKPIVRSLRGRVFPNLVCVRIRKTDITIGLYGIDAVIEAAHLPFLVAPNAEYIEAYCHSLRYRQSPQSFIPQNHSNPQLRHLIISQTTLTLSVLQQVLAHFPGLIRIGVDGIQSDEGVYLNTSDNEVSRLLTELPILSTSLRRIDFITSWTVDSLMVVAIAKLPSLRMVTIRAASEMLDEYKEEIGKSV